MNVYLYTATGEGNSTSNNHPPCHNSDGIFGADVQNSPAKHGCGTTYLAQTTQLSTSAAAPATMTTPTPTQPMPPTTGELAGDEGRAPKEGTKEVVEEEEPPQGSIEAGDKVRKIPEEGEEGALKGEDRGIAVVPEEEAVQEEEEVIPLQMDNFLGQPASPLPVLTSPTEISPPEDVLQLEGPSHPDDLQIIDLSYDSGAGREEQRR